MKGIQLCYFFSGIQLQKRLQDLTDHVQADHPLERPLYDQLVLGDGLVPRSAPVEAAVIEIDKVAGVHLDAIGAVLLHSLWFRQSNYRSTENITNGFYNSKSYWVRGIELLILKSSMCTRKI